MTQFILPALQDGHGREIGDDSDNINGSCNDQNVNLAFNQLKSKCASNVLPSLMKQLPIRGLESSTRPPPENSLFPPHLVYRRLNAAKLSVSKAIRIFQLSDSFIYQRSAIVRL